MEHSNENEVLLEVKGLDVSFQTRRGELHAVNGISYDVRKGEIMGLVGESGSGKSVEAYSIMGLLRPPARINGGSVSFGGKDVFQMTKKELESFRGNEVSMIFQDPLSFLDPVFTIEQQMVETIRAHDKKATRQAAKAASVNMLKEVKIRNPERVMKQYPFELSGGMRQRVMIAIALLCKPKLLIADEPTTALDVTIQAQVIQILKGLQEQTGMAMVYITHNFGIVAELCDRVSVMYGGYILEQGDTYDIFYDTAHPYTKMLLKTVLNIDGNTKGQLAQIEGTPIDQVAMPEGCVFHPRCESCMDVCKTSFPPETFLGPGHSAKCWLQVPDEAEKGKWTWEEG
ncbi:MAG: ABC transporter ATP-binding protein [Oscillospiraceae bacterium]|nr:ABC transporter ATP-binding protein [Oscillospiraceae bacterium]